MRPVAGIVTSATSMVLSATALTKSAVLPVLTVTCREGNLRRRSFNNGGSRKMHAVAPVPIRTRPMAPEAWRPTASTASAACLSIALA